MTTPPDTTNTTERAPRPSVALDEEEIPEVTGLPPAPPLENKKIPLSSSDSRRDGG